MKRPAEPSGCVARAVRQLPAQINDHRRQCGTELGLLSTQTKNGKPANQLRVLSYFQNKITGGFFAIGKTAACG